MDDFKPKWGRTFGVSVLFHALLLLLIGYLMGLVPVPQVHKSRLKWNW